MLNNISVPGAHEDPVTSFSEHRTPYDPTLPSALYAKAEGKIERLELLAEKAYLKNHIHYLINQYEWLTEQVLIAVEQVQDIRLNLLELPERGKTSIISDIFVAVFLAIIVESNVVGVALSGIALGLVKFFIRLRKTNVSRNAWKYIVLDNTIGQRKVVEKQVYEALRKSPGRIKYVGTMIDRGQIERINKRLDNFVNLCENLIKPGYVGKPVEAGVKAAYTKKSTQLLCEEDMDANDSPSASFLQTYKQNLVDLKLWVNLIITDLDMLTEYSLFGITSAWDQLKSSINELKDTLINNENTSKEVGIPDDPIEAQFFFDNAKLHFEKILWMMLYGKNIKVDTKDQAVYDNSALQEQIRGHFLPKPELKGYEQKTFISKGVIKNELWNYWLKRLRDQNGKKFINEEKMAKHLLYVYENIHQKGIEHCLTHIYHSDENIESDNS